MSATVGIIMGSISDLETMKPAAEILAEFGVPTEMKVVSAHRTPEAMVTYARTAVARGLKVIIAGAGGAAHLPGMVASLTILPVIGVPVKTKALGGVDSLYSIVQIPVATVSIGNGKNAGILAARILAISDSALAENLEAFAAQQRDAVAAMNEQLNSD